MAQATNLNIFFDLDGTLIDVSLRNYKVYSEVTRKFGGKPLERSIYWNLKRKKTKWPELLPMSKLPINIEEDYLSQFISKIEAPEYLKLDTLFPDTISVLRSLSAQYECYLVSLRRNEQNLLRELDDLGVRKYFVQILSGHSETDGYDKKIEIIGEVLKGALGVIIGDTEADVIAGKTLGIKTIALSSGIREEKFLAALKPDYLVAEIKNVAELLSS